MDEDYDDIIVTEDEPERPAKEPAFDLRAFAAEMARANAAAIKEALSELREVMAPKPEPAAPSAPKSPGEAMRHVLKSSLGLDDYMADRYARAAATDALADEYGDDPAVKRALDARRGDARMIEGLSGVMQEIRRVSARLDEREAAEKAAREREQQRVGLRALAKAKDSPLRKLAPHLFDGDLSPEHEALLDTLDLETLERTLPHVDKLVARARPKSRRLSPVAGGVGSEKPKEFEVVSDAQWARDFDRAAAGEEMN